MTAYGVLSVAKGWHFFPISVMLKGVSQVTLTGHFLHQVTVLIGCPHCCLRYTFFWVSRFRTGFAGGRSPITLPSSRCYPWQFILHWRGSVCCSATRPHLIALAVVAIAAALPLGRIWLESWTTALLTSNRVRPFSGRFLLSTTATQQMTAAIYTQQYQLRAVPCGLLPPRESCSQRHRGRRLRERCPRSRSRRPRERRGSFGENADR